MGVISDGSRSNLPSAFDVTSSKLSPILKIPVIIIIIIQTITGDTCSEWCTVELV